MSITWEELEAEYIEKGIRTVIVPPTENRAGYQYQRVFSDNKRENTFQGKGKKDFQSVTIGKLKKLLKDISDNTNRADKKDILQKKAECTLSFTMGKYPAIHYHESRNPFTNKISPQDASKRQTEFFDAQFLARKGFEVYLNEENSSTKSYDAIINNLPFDFKNISGNLGTVKKRYQDGLKQATGVVLFFASRTSSDYRRYAAMMNGATNTSKPKTVTIICFQKEKEVEFFDMRNVVKKADGTEKQPRPKSAGVITPNSSSIPHKSRAVNKSIRFEFENITKTNRYEKMEKAVRCLSKALRVPIGIEKSEKSGEGFVFKAQEDLTKKWDKFFDDYTKSVYEFVTSYFGLPKAENTTVKKAISDDVLTHKGKVLYECESGKPIKKADWDKFVKNLEKFMNKNLKDSEKKIILNSTALSKVLNRMLQYNTFDAVKQLPLMDLNYNDKSFDWISDSVKNMQNAFGNSFSRQEQARIEIMQQSAGLKITNIDNKMRSDIQTILVDGVKNHKSKSDVAQMLFDKMTGDNRDFKRLADTEMQNAFNNGFVREEVYNTPEGEKTYFQRIEVIDDNTCPFCRRMNGKIALWSDKPLSSQNADDGIADFVIWEGKEWSGEKDDVCTGAFHPWCRGAWIRYYPNEK